MSPEQAKGKRVDKRADIWAFGVVLYEMLTGKHPYAGETVSEILASVIKDEPNLARLPAETPNNVRSLVRRCLTKDPNKRLRDIGEARITIDPSEVELETDAPPSKGSSSLWVAAVAASLVAGVIIGAIARTPGERPRAPARFVVTPPASESLRLWFDYGDLAITPDGSRIVYSVTVDGRPRLVVQAIGQLEATSLSGLGNSAGGPFFSPDGNWIGYFDYDNVLRKVSIHGGPPVTLGTLPGFARGASWGDDDTIVFATAEPNGLWRLPSNGGTAEKLIELSPDRGEHLWPEILPGGDALLLTIQTGAIENAQIAVLSLSTGESKVVVSGGSNPRYVPTGHIVYGVSGALWAVGFDLERLEATSEPVRVLDGVVTKPRGAADFSVARDGSLVYVKGRPFDTERTRVWVDRQGREAALNAPPRYYFNTRLSPDGSRLALDVRDQENDIWIWEFARETLTRLTFDSGPDVYPTWTPDGLRVAFSSRNPRNIFWKVADGTGRIERLPESENPQFPHAFSPDGKRLVVREAHPERGHDLAMLSLDEGGPSTALVATEFNEQNPEISPDGLFLAYQSDESGRFEIYVRPFPDVEDGRWQVSRNGGTHPLWAHSGQELFYRTLAGQLVAVPVRRNPSVEFGDPEIVVHQPYFAPPGRAYDVSHDGERFLMVKEGGAAETDLILV